MTEKVAGRIDLFRRWRAHKIRAEGPARVRRGLTGAGRGALSAGVACRIVLPSTTAPSISGLTALSKSRIANAWKSLPVASFFRPDATRYRLNRFRCPFCAAGVQPDATLAPGWPLLAVGCLHSFLDGWTIGLSLAALSNAAAALPWGAIVPGSQRPHPSSRSRYRWSAASAIFAT
jgi:hypothetical protein